MTKSHFIVNKKIDFNSIEQKGLSLGEKDKSNGKQKNQNDQAL